MPDATNETAQNDKTMSLDVQMGMVREAWRAAFPNPGEAAPIAADTATWVCEVFTDSVIVEFAGKHYRAPYSTGEDGKPQFAARPEWIEVESKREWVEAAKAAKAGARNNADDKQRIRNIRAAARQIHDTTMEMEPDDMDADEETPNGKGASHSWHQGRPGQVGGSSSSGGGGSSGGSGPAAGSRGFSSPMDEFRFVNKRLKMGGLKKGERQMLERRAERLAKEALGVSDKAVKSMAMDADTIAACQDCIKACQECIDVCTTCPNRDATHAACVQACRNCMAECANCIQKCENGESTEDTRRACYQCAEACMECVEMAEECASCPDCKSVCQVCSERCGECADCCRNNAGMQMMDADGLPAFMSLPGNALKAIAKTDDELRVGNYIVLFNQPDLEGIGSKRLNADGSRGEQFDPGVNVESDYTATGTLHVDWEHGLDPDGIGAGADVVLGRVDWKTAKRDEKGIFVERVLNRRNKYVRWLEDLIEAGMIGNSSESTRGVEKTADGRITRWPLKRDTLTVNPMQPQMMTDNVMTALKSLGVNLSTTGSTTTAQPEAAGNAAASATPEPDTTHNGTDKELPMDENEIKLIADAAAKAAVEEFRKSAPAAPSGVAVTHDEGDNPFTSLAEQCKAVKAWEESKGRKSEPRLDRLMKATGASEGIPSEGGFLLEPTLTSDILKPMHEEGPFYQGTRKLPVSANSNYGWINGVDETSRADGSRWGGIRGYRLAEAGTKTASKPAFRRINWELKKFAVVCYATDELLADAAQFSAVARMGAGEELNFMVNDDILNGSGVAGPLGILSAGSLIAVAKEGGQGADTIVNRNLMKMWARVSPRSKSKAVWYYNTDCGPQLHQMALEVGTAALEARFVTYAADGTLRIYGRPAVETEFNATLGDQGDIVVADLSEYLLWEKGGVQEASSIHVQFLTDETVFRFVYRVDGQPALASALTPYKGGNTTSPFVTLAARA